MSFSRAQCEDAEAGQDNNDSEIQLVSLTFSHLKASKLDLLAYPIQDSGSTGPYMRAGTEKESVSEVEPVL